MGKGKYHLGLVFAGSKETKVMALREDIPYSFSRGKLCRCGVSGLGFNSRR